jgi:opacity protein-like surface antigen
MRRWSVVVALTVGPFLGVGGMASAADMPLKALPPPVPLFVWTGFYGGANVSYSWGSSVATTNLNPTLLADIGATIPGSYSDGVYHRGWEASVEGGYCYQPGRDRNSNFVACLEVRYDFPAERSGQTTTATIPTPATTVTSTTHIDPLLIGPHLGFTTNANSTFWYAAGGLAVGQVGGSSVGTGLGGTSTANPASAWVTGWFAGAGAEQMLNGNWSLKVEYDYVHLDTGGVTAQYTGSNVLLNGITPYLYPASATVASHPFDNVVTVGINYHFH